MFGPDFFNRQVVRLARWQNRSGWVGEAAHFLLKLHGTDIHRDVPIPEDLRLRHGCAVLSQGSERGLRAGEPAQIS